MNKIGRNDPCPCGSGKKYKKCCESKTKHKKFHAEVLATEAKPTMASLFQRNVIAPLPKPSEESKNIVM
jgi:hypothetical protein